MNKIKFITARPFADANTAAGKLIEIANNIGDVQDGRIYLLVNAPFLAARTYYSRFKGRNLFTSQSSCDYSSSPKDRY